MKRLVGLAISLILLVLIWRGVDVDRILAAARGSDPAWLAAGLAMVVPLTAATAWRFGLLSRTPLPMGVATRLILSASTLNLVLPSKMGDLAKAWVLTRRYGFAGPLALAIVVLEKLIDLAALLAWGLLATLWIGARDPWMWLAAAALAGMLALLFLLLLPVPLGPRLMQALGGRLPGPLGRAAHGFGAELAGVVAWFWTSRTRAWRVLALSLAIWAGHLAQFWLFARALRAAVPFVDNMAYATLSILVGLAPFTMAGVGTRDAAILFFYRDVMTPGQAAVLGVLATTRYLMPALAGLPFMRDYLPARGERAAR